MNSLLGLIIQIINLYQFILLIYIIATWLLNFNIINSSNRIVYNIMEAMYRLCEPSLNLVRRYIPNFGTVDVSPIVVYLMLWFFKSFPFTVKPKIMVRHLSYLFFKHTCIRLCYTFNCRVRINFYF